MSSYGDLLLDFDLDYLNQNTTPSVVPSRTDKQKRAVLIAKKKTIATDSLIRKYYEKREIVEKLERSLIEAKEECKKICIDHTHSLQKITSLEEKEQQLIKENGELHQSYEMSENRYLAIQSHAHQLQVLAKENTLKIEAMEIESRLEKAHSKELERRVTSLEKEKAMLHEHICMFRDIVFGKQKIDQSMKIALNKYKEESEKVLGEVSDAPDENVEGSGRGGSPVDDDLSCDEEELTCPKKVASTDVKASFISQGTTEEQMKHVYELDSDSSNDVVSSVDTGRGSSLASSDPEKNILSPCSDKNSVILNNIAEYEYQRAVQETVIITIEPETNKVIEECEIGEITTLEKSVCADVLNKCKGVEIENCNDRLDATLETKKYGKDKTQNINNEKVCMSSIFEPISTEPASPTIVSKSQLPNNIISKDINECLKQNSSKKVKSSKEIRDDMEITSILDTMTLRLDVITPIPSSPSTVMSSTTEEASHGCVEALKLREENKAIRESLANLASQVLEIKSLLHGQLVIRPINNDHKTIEEPNKDLKSQFIESIVGPRTRTEERDDILNDLITIPPPISPSSSNSCALNNANNKCNNDVSPVREAEGMEEPYEDLIDLIPEESSNQKRISNGEKTDDRPCIDRLDFVQSLTTKDHVASLNASGAQSECNQSLTNNVNSVKHKRKARLTKLEKMRNRLAPKSKIKVAEDSTPKKLKSMNDLKPISNSKSANQRNVIELNNKAVYDKAVAVAKEIRAKQNNKKDSFIRRENLSRNCKISSPEKDQVAKNPNEKSSPTLTVIEIADKESPVCDNKRRKRNSSMRSSCSADGDHAVTTRSQAKQAFTASPTTPMSFVEPKSINFSTDNFVASPTKVSPSSKVNNRKRSIDEMQNNSRKRILRSNSMKSVVETSPPDFKNCAVVVNADSIIKLDKIMKRYSHADKPDDDVSAQVNVCNLAVKDYSDMDLFSECSVAPTVVKKIDNSKIVHPKDSIICKMIEKYGIKSSYKKPPKVTEKTIESISMKLETDIEAISQLQGCEVKDAMNNLVADIKKMDYNGFLMGLMHYLKQPVRKEELLSKTCLPPAPPMSKTEQILVYILTQLKGHWPQTDIVDDVMRGIEWTLFRLNWSPEVASVEVLAHMFAVLARLVRAKLRLRMFVLDAMYCLRFKAVPLVQQCLDVWMHILPLAHQGLAQSPLVTCLVYLLHFFKCEDHHNKVGHIRFILQKRYSYNMSDWNDKRFLEFIKTAILDLREMPIEKKMLRTSLVILGKRKGPQWCQKHIIRGLLLPIIEDQGLPERTRNFCLTLMGPLLKPFPNEMKVNIEIFLYQLVNMFKETDSHQRKEAIISSLLTLCRHNQYSVLSLLLGWKPQTTISKELEDVLKDFVREKSIKWWTQLLSKHCHC